MMVRSVLVWTLLTVTIVSPLFVAAQSPLLQWREPVYVIAGFAGIFGLTLLLVQPLLISGTLPGIPARKVHFWVGAALLIAVIIHVAGLWITSPPDVVDVLLFRSPTPFSVWGNLAMWAVFMAALLAVWRKRVGLRIWRIGHSACVVVIVIGSVIHVLLIEGPMGDLTKAVLCALVLLAGVKALRDRRAWRMFR